MTQRTKILSFLDSHDLLKFNGIFIKSSPVHKAFCVYAGSGEGRTQGGVV